ncbi:MAG: hypothetical protein B7Z66_02485 [Chromatiales bacterium 21-64-14]|nr:MAG: hypothetical protein B7Z66_02485 [Chromatiales bacterium 21-64-14]HQU14489.1 DUF494 domain-containing protein [Gammaproteobacteria bacterium]
MKENVLDVLMYLFENYYLDSETEFQPERSVLQGKLLEAGFPTLEVEKAFDWLEDLVTRQENSLQGVQTYHSLRLFNAQEVRKLDLEARGFLMFLEQMGILTPANRELVIDRAMALETEEIDLEQLKWVTLMVLFNQPGQEAAYAWMEDLVFDNTGGYLH